jgi:pectate lyase/transcriptional regulator
MIKKRNLIKTISKCVTICTLAMSIVGTQVIKASALNDGATFDSVGDTQNTGTTTSILASEGWLESANVEWSPVQNASGYNVYYKAASASDSEYKKIDSELIRKYPSYFRADVLGIAQGNYVIKIVPVINNTEDITKQAITQTLQVKAYTREGFAFSSQSSMKTGSGGYNDDGTIPSNAQIIYITPDNVNTVTLGVITSTKGTKTNCTGITDILAKRQKGIDKTPLIIRMIGQVKASDINGLNSSGYLQLKGCYNVTFEGVGDDATVYKWGILVRAASNVEIRNIGVMLFPDDGISLDTDNQNIWIHNNDIFYGTPGSDADQVKGDGSCDVKQNSTFVTVSYNHFWDSGKASLCGMSDSENFYVSYHHNWFDHSDSRHPRIRVGSIHVYNNYYDGNAKYGVGVTKGASAFVEANYFRNCQSPMLSSLQGTDVYYDSKGTFSGEAGGMIKAYNNIIIGARRLVYANQDFTQDSATIAKDTINFDAYLASSRDEAVPSTYKTVSGATTYNNFDTSATMYSYKPNAAADVPSIVTTYAGRVNGGDLKWNFTDADDADYLINTGLKAKIMSYTSSLNATQKIINSITAPVEVTVEQGKQANLPSTVTATYSDGSSSDVTVLWGAVDTSTVGNKTVHGTILGYTQGVDIQVVVTAASPVVQKTISSITTPASITVQQGKEVNLPSTVTVIYSDGSNSQLKVTWDKVDTSTVGSKSVNGKVDGYVGKITIAVNVIANVQNDFTINSVFNSNNLQPNTLLEAKTDVTNNKSTLQSVIAMVALYDENEKMVNICYISKNIPIGTSDNLNSGFKLPNDIANYKVKVFVWDGTSLTTSTMQPLSNIVTLGTIQ